MCAAEMTGWGVLRWDELLREDCGQGERSRRPISRQFTCVALLRSQFARARGPGRRLVSPGAMIARPHRLNKAQRLAGAARVTIGLSLRAVLALVMRVRLLDFRPLKFSKTASVVFDFFGCQMRPTHPGVRAERCGERTAPAAQEEREQADTKL